MHVKLLLPCLTSSRVSVSHRHALPAAGPLHRGVSKLLRQWGEHGWWGRGGGTEVGAAAKGKLGMGAKLQWGVMKGGPRAEYFEMLKRGVVEYAVEYNSKE